MDSGNAKSKRVIKKPKVARKDEPVKPKYEFVAMGNAEYSQ